MADHDRFKDFLPEDKGFEIPARAQFYERVRQLHDKYLEESLEKLRATLDGAGKEELQRHLDAGYGIIPSFIEKRVPLAIFGADEIAIDAVYAPDEGEEYYVVPARLYREGSPYMPEELQEQGVNFGQVWIAVSSAPEEAPFVFHFEDRERTAEALGKKYMTIEEFKLYKQQQGAPLAELTDEQAVGLIGQLEQQEIDLVDIADQIPKLR